MIEGDLSHCSIYVNCQVYLLTLKIGTHHAKQSTEITRIINPTDSSLLQIFEAELI